jgi:hypothetical protein
MSDFNQSRFDVLLAIAEDRGVDITVSPEYCEPGYTMDGDGPLLLADWNSRRQWGWAWVFRSVGIDHRSKAEMFVAREERVVVGEDNTAPRLSDLFAKLGCTIDWYDEYQLCNDCQKAFRTSGDSYGWTQYGFLSEDGHAVCGDCIKDDPDDYLEELEGNPRKAVTLDVDLEKQGYVCLNWDEKGCVTSYENGLYGGQCDEPGKVAEALDKRKITRYLFNVDSVGQFDLDFSVWIHRDELNLEEGSDWDTIFAAIEKFREEPIDSEGVDPAEMLKKGLQQCTANYERGKVVHNRINLSDGSVETKTLTAEEFVEHGIQ